MKKILLLLVILGGLIATAVWYQDQQNQTLNTAASRGVKTREQLLPNLDVSAVQKIRLKDATSEVNIVVNEDRKGAKITERNGYPASLERLNTVLTELREQKIASKQPLGKGAWAKEALLPPGEGSEGVGTQVELITHGDKVLASMILGKQVESAGGVSASPMSGGNQRMVRIPEDGDTIWVISNTFFDLETKPESWLEKAFIDVQKIKDITLTNPKADESWKVGRAKDEDVDFDLLDPKNGEALDRPKLPVSSLLSAPTFNDVHPKEKSAELLKDALKATITTFDGFTYDIQVAKVAKDGADKYFMSVAVKAEIPKTRTPVKDEKEEDKKKAEEAFAADKKSKEEKLAKEQRFAGWIYEVSEYTVNSLFKKRSEIVKVAAKAEPAAAAPAATPEGASPNVVDPKKVLQGMSQLGGAASATTPPISVTTPPVAVPPVPTPEVKPAPSPEANPAVPEKK